MTHKFTYTRTESDISTTVEVHEDANIPTMLEAFETYLKACGYEFDCILRIYDGKEDL